MRLDGELVQLTKNEFRLLRVLMSQPTRAFTREELNETIWGYGALKSRTLDSHASRLRQKLAMAGAHELVVNVWGVGYRLIAAVPSESRHGCCCPTCGQQLPEVA